MEKELEIRSRIAEKAGIVYTSDVQEVIREYESRGYRLDMIFPADSPREALLSNERESVRLRKRGLDQRSETNSLDIGLSKNPHTSQWVRGRAGMEYRDLIPDRLGGKTIASHIRLAGAGEIADYVHYHKVDFQMIYCITGRIKVVYEDQGPPFWLETGDCVVQPPEIRHRVLECTAGAEVLEVSMPAEHETWIDHETTLPNEVVNPGRDFGGQQFVFTKHSGS